MNFYEEMIKNSNQKYIIRLYNSKRKYIEFLEKTDNKEELQRAKEDLLLLELMITKKKPTLELADKKDFYEFSNQVNNDKDYLKENVTGNEDIKVLNYSSAPFIKMPVAQ